MHTTGFWKENFFGLHKLGRSRLSLGNLIHTCPKLCMRAGKKMFGLKECSLDGTVVSCEYIYVCPDMISQHLGNFFQKYWIHETTLEKSYFQMIT